MNSTDMASTVIRRLAVIDQPGDLIPAQGLWLAQAAVAMGADLALDLGTGAGNSAAILSAVCERVRTFDRNDGWAATARQLAAAGSPADNVTQHVGDMTKLDFRPLIGSAKSVLVFWDAHGFDVAELVLGHILPFICYGTHRVVCHDMSPSAPYAPSYGGRRLWRGMAQFYDSPDEFSDIKIGDFYAKVDQIISVVDFCARNEICLHSVDREISAAERALFAQLTDRVVFHMAHFSMNETALRHFPRDPREPRHFSTPAIEMS